jgi:hypothetical protein
VAVSGGGVDDFDEEHAIAPPQASTAARTTCLCPLGIT